MIAAAITVVPPVALLACGSSGEAPTRTATSSTAAVGASLDDCVQPDARARAVRFSAAGEQVTGAEFGRSGTLGVVLAHEHGANLCGWVAYAEHLRDLGYRALAFDFRTNLTADVSGAASELRHEGVTRIVLMGASMGGTASLVAASTSSTTIAGVAALSAPSSFMGLDGLSASRQLTLPVLYIATQDNGDFPDDARTMYAACPSADKQLQVLSGSDHGTAMLHGAVAGQTTSLLDAFIAGTAPSTS